MTTPAPHTAAAKLSPSRLSNQLEGLRDDLDLTSLNLAIKGAASFHLLESITGGEIERTIEGASTVTLNVRDRDLALVRSGVLGSKFDINIDGLWFRIKDIEAQGDGRDLVLTFEDREVALLRSYPNKNAPKTWFKAWNATGKTITRARVMKWLVDEVKELDLRFVCPMLKDAKALAPISEEPDVNTKLIERHPGLFDGAPLTVKGAAATEAQRRNLEALMSLGWTMPVTQGASLRKFLVVAVMVVTAETRAGADVGFNPRAIGMFQQDPTQGWPATGDINIDGAEFYTRLVAKNAQYPSLDLAVLAAEVQRPLAYLLSRDASAYGQWRTEAERTVEAFLPSFRGGVDDHAVQGPFEIPAGGVTDVGASSAPQFVRGVRRLRQTVGERGVIITIHGKPTVVEREDNWECLQRLAAEVGWRCFCVSGTVYIVTDQHLFQSRVMHRIYEDAPGLVGLPTGRIGERMKNAQLVVNARMGRWQAPPGSVAAVEDLGPFSGRWLVTNIRRKIFNPAGTITLKKPQPILPESQAPEYGAGKSSGEISLTKNGTARPGSAGDATEGPVRDRIVAAAKKAFANRGNYRYEQIRPIPPTLFPHAPELGYPVVTDCSGFATLCYKAAGAPDPNGFDYNGQGNTATLVDTGVWVTDAEARPGDLVFYGDTRDFPHHVTVYVGDGKVISMSSPTAGLIEIPMLYRIPIGVMTYGLGEDG